MDFTREEFENLNRIAAKYDVHKFDILMRGYMLRSFAPYFRGNNALEMGCFQGEFTQLLERLFERLTVVDAAEEFIAHARRRVGPQVKFISSLFETLDLTERFDAVFLTHVLEHLDDPITVLKKARELLSDRGRAFLAVPNANAPSRQIAVKMGLLAHNTALTEADVKHGHRRVYSFDTLERDALAAGLKIVQRGGVFFKGLANYQFEALLGGDVISDGYMEGCYQLGMQYPDLCASIFLVCEK